MTAETFVGIDQSYSGFAVTVLSGDTHETCVASFPPTKYQGDGHRLEVIQQWLFDTIDAATTVDPVGVAMEGYSMGSKFGREKAGELGGATKLELWQRFRVNPQIVPPTSLKKYVLGSAAGKGKNLMLLGVYKKWDVEFTNDNAADSYALARLAQAIEEPDRIQFKYEQEVIDVVTKS